jgi:hypothetical protein
MEDVLTRYQRVVLCPLGKTPLIKGLLFLPDAFHLETAIQQHDLDLIARS